MILENRIIIPVERTVLYKIALTPVAIMNTTLYRGTSTSNYEKQKFTSN